MYATEASLRLIKNTDSHFQNLDEVELLNTICHFEHKATLKFSYKSPISLRYIKQGEIRYKGEHSHRASSINNIFLLTKPKKIEAITNGDILTEGFSVYFDSNFIRDNLLKRLKKLQFQIKDSDKICNEFSTELLVSGENDQLRICCEEIFEILECYRWRSNEMSRLFREIQSHLLDFLVENYTNAQNLKLQRRDSKKEVVRRLFLGKNYIFNNYSNNIKLEQIAENAFLSKYCFQRYFKAFFKLSPNKYLTKLRLEKALELLKFEHKPIASIAMECGFNSAQYFTYSFKNVYGHSPNLIRKLLD